MISNKEYVSKMTWLAMHMDPRQIYGIQRGDTLTRWEVERWAQEGISGPLGIMIAQMRMETANMIYSAYIKDIYYDR